MALGSTAPGGCSMPCGRSTWRQQVIRGWRAVRYVSSSYTKPEPLRCSRRRALPGRACHPRKTATARRVRSVDREKWSLERGVDVGCGKFAWGKQRLGGSILTVAAALRSLSGRFWAGGPTGQQTGQAGQHRTDRTDRTASRTAETVLSSALAAAAACLHYA